MIKAAIYNLSNGHILRIVQCPESMLDLQMEDGEDFFLNCPTGATHIIDNTPTTISTPPSFEERVREYTRKVQQWMDATARARNYDNILSACTYATSTVSKFQAEGQRCVEWRDAVWTKCYEILAEVQEGIIPEPAVEEFLTQLPELTWPEV